MGSANGAISIAAVIASPDVDDSATGVVHKKCKMWVVDGRGSFVPEETAGPSFLVEAFMPDLTRTSCEHKQYLDSLGFRLSCCAGSAGISLAESRPSVVGGTGTSDKAGPTANNPGGCYKALVSQPFDRVLVEGCCEPGSLLSKPTKYSRGCKVIPITKDDDFASESGIRTCTTSIERPSDTLGFSAPCTGGST